MLEITKIQYTEKPSGTHPDETTITGRLSMHYALVVDNHGKVSRDAIKEEIAEHIWRKCYGDLTQPLMELQSIVIHYVRPEYYGRVRELCDQLNALLTRKRMKLPTKFPAKGWRKVRVGEIIQNGDCYASRVGSGTFAYLTKIDHAMYSGGADPLYRPIKPKRKKK